MTALSGKCLCGAVTWQAKGPVLWSGICHCGTCRRANSAPMVPFFGVPRDGLGITGETLIFHSSPGVERGFCAKCGSPIFYRNEKWPDETHLMSATLDDPALVPPREHYHWGERLPWVVAFDDLPKHAASAEDTV